MLSRRSGVRVVFLFSEAADKKKAIGRVFEFCCLPLSCSFRELEDTNCVNRRESGACVSVASSDNNDFECKVKSSVHPHCRRGEKVAEKVNGMGAGGFCQ